MPTILEMVRAGYGYAALTASALNHAKGDASLAVLPIVEPSILSTLCLVQSSKKQATPLIKRTAEVLRKLSLQVNS